MRPSREFTELTRGSAAREQPAVSHRVVRKPEERLAEFISLCSVAGVEQSERHCETPDVEERDCPFLGGAVTSG